MLYKKNDWKLIIQFAYKVISVVLAVVLVGQLAAISLANIGMSSIGMSSLPVIQEVQSDLVQMGRRSLLAAMDEQIPEGYMEMEISDAKQLLDFAARVASGEFSGSALVPGTSNIDTAGVYVRLTSDIYLTDADEETGMTPATYWEPIGTEAQPFTGIFNGKGHTIYGLDPNLESGNTIFGVLVGATIQNLKVEPSSDLGLQEDSLDAERHFYAVGENVTLINCSVKEPSTNIQLENQLLGLEPDYAWFYDSCKEERQELKAQAEILAQEGGTMLSMMAIAAGHASSTLAVTSPDDFIPEDLVDSGVIDSSQSIPTATMGVVVPGLLQKASWMLPIAVRSNDLHPLFLAANTPPNTDLNQGAEEGWHGGRNNHGRVFEISTFEQLAAVANIVQKGYSFYRQIIVIRRDIDGQGRTLYPIGDLLNDMHNGAPDNNNRLNGLFPHFAGKIIGWTDPVNGYGAAYESSHQSVVTTNTNNSDGPWYRLIRYDDHYRPAVISNVNFVPRRAGGAAGFIGLGMRAFVENLVFRDCTVTGTDKVAMVMARSAGCFFNRVGVEGGTINGLTDVGGIVGNNMFVWKVGATATGDTAGNSDIVQVNPSTDNLCPYVDSAFTTNNIKERAQIFNSYCTASINATQNVGGIIGSTEHSQKITGGVVGCFFSGTITADINVGGIMGAQLANTNYNIVTCSASSGVISGSVNVGGIMGYTAGGDHTIQDCYSSATINGANAVGGILGARNGSSPKIKFCYFSGKIRSTPLTMYDSASKDPASATSTNLNSGDVLGNGIGPIVGSGVEGVTNNTNSPIYSNFFCRSCLENLQATGAMLTAVSASDHTDDENLSQNTRLELWVNSHHLSYSGRNSGGSANHADFSTQYACAHFDQSNYTFDPPNGQTTQGLKNNMPGWKSSTGVQRWNQGNLMLNGNPYYVAHLAGVTGNHPTLVAFTTIKAGVPDARGQHIFANFGNMSTLANMDVPSVLYISKMTASSSGYTHDGQYPYSFTQTKGGTTPFVYENPSGVTGWEIIDASSGMVILPDTGKPTSGSAMASGTISGGTIINTIRMPDPASDSSYITLIVKQTVATSNTPSRISFHFDRPSVRDVKFIVRTLSNNANMNVSYEVTVKDSGLRIPDSGVPAALNPGVDMNSRPVLDRYESTFFFQFPQQEVLDISTATIEVESWNLDHQGTRTPYPGSGTQKAIIYKAENNTTSSTAGFSQQGTLTVSGGSLLRLSGPSFLQRSRGYRFTIKGLKDASGNLMTDREAKVIDNVAFDGWTVGDRDPVIAFRDPEDPNLSTIDRRFYFEGDYKRYKKSGVGLANTDFMDETFTIKQGSAADKTIHIRKNDVNASKIHWQEIYIQAGDDAFSDYWSMGIALTDNEAISLKIQSLHSSGTDSPLIKIQKLNVTTQPPDLTLDNFYLTPGRYQVVYLGEDIAGNLTPNAIVRFYEVVSPPQIVVQTTDGQLDIQVYGDNVTMQRGVKANFSDMGFIISDNQLIDAGKFIQQNMAAGTDILEAARRALTRLTLQQYGKFFAYRSTIDAHGNATIEALIPHIDPLAMEELNQLLVSSTGGNFEHTYGLYSADPQAVLKIMNESSSLDEVLLKLEGLQAFKNEPVERRSIIFNEGSSKGILDIVTINEDLGGTANIQNGMVNGSLAPPVSMYEVKRTKYLSLVDYSEHGYNGNQDAFCKGEIGEPILTWTDSSGAQPVIKVLTASDGVRGGWVAGQTINPNNEQAQVLTYQITSIFNIPLPKPITKEYTIMVTNDGAVDGQENAIKVVPGKVDPYEFWDNIAREITEAESGQTVQANVPYECRYIPVTVLQQLAAQNKITLEMYLEHKVVVSIDSDSVDLTNVPEGRTTYNVYIGPMHNMWVSRDALGYGRHFQQFYTVTVDDVLGDADHYYGDVTITMPLDEELLDAKSLQLYTYNNANRTYTLLQSLPRKSINRENGTVTITLKGVPYGEYVLGTNISAPILNPETGGYALDDQSVPKHIAILAQSKGLLEKNTGPGKAGQITTVGAIQAIQDLQNLWMVALGVLVAMIPFIIVAFIRRRKGRYYQY